MRLIVTCGVGLLLAGPAWGGLNYGDFNAGDVMYLQVTEQSATDAVPLYGQPIVAGNGLLFNNMTFTSLASGGSSDVTNGLLSTTIMAADGLFVDQVVLEEAGDYTLAGLEGEATATVEGMLTVSIIEVDGQAIAPVGFSMDLSFNPSDGDFLLSEDGSATAMAWEGGVSLDLTSFLMGIPDFDFIGGATKVAIELDNTLSTMSDPFTEAFITKKEVGGLAMTAIVPAPGALSLLGVAFVVSGRRRRYG